MTSSATDTVPVLTIRRPGDLIEAVPYLLGFHPRRSLVVVGLAESKVSVTARLDLGPEIHSSELGDVVAVLARSNSQQAVVVVYGDDEPVAHQIDDYEAGDRLPYAEWVDQLAQHLAQQNMPVLDALLVRGDRYFSYLCRVPECCPPQGRSLPGDASAAAATATYAGLVAFPDRQAVLDSIAPLPCDSAASLGRAVEAAENVAMQALLAGRHKRHQNALKREIFAAARRSDESLFAGTELTAGVDDVARFCVALSDSVVRDALWLAIDSRRLDGSRLWLDLARRSLAPYSAAPYFLHAWAQWRAGNGTMARAAVEQVLASDPDYSAGWLLISALDHGLDPRKTPRLRPGPTRRSGSGAGPTA